MVILGKPPYPSFTQFVNELKVYDMREEDSEKDHIDQAMDFQAYRRHKDYLVETEEIL